jgi:predicted HNH restriction endonuclease
MENKKCEFCNNEFSVTSSTKRKRFCDSSCSAKFNNAKRGSLSEVHKQSISDSLKKTWSENRDRFSSGEDHSKIVGLAVKNKDKKINSIYELSSRTVSKIFRRLGLGCSNCGWVEGTCDVHHIKGRKIPDCNNHNNLSLLCPNCHRLVHEKKIKTNELKTLVEILPDNWQDSYYG